MKIRKLNPDDPIDLMNQVKSLFKDMFVEMQGFDLAHDLKEEGESIWLDSVKRMLNKTIVIFYALEEDKIFGFSVGSVRLLPAFLGIKKLGFISYVYVDPSMRSSTIGTHLVTSLEQWFGENNCLSIELEVLNKNLPAHRFWRKLGYQDNMIIMRKNAQI